MANWRSASPGRVAPSQESSQAMAAERLMPSDSSRGWGRGGAGAGVNRVRVPKLGGIGLRRPHTGGPPTSTGTPALPSPLFSPPPQLSPGSEDDEGHDGVSRENLGRIQFSVGYNFQESTLTVKIMKAQELPAKDFSGTSDPFVKIYLLPDKKHKLETKVKRKNLNPHWNETFLFEGRGWDGLEWTGVGAERLWDPLSSLLGWISSARAASVVAISDEMGWPSHQGQVGGVCSASHEGHMGGDAFSPPAGTHGCVHTRELICYQPPWWPEAKRGAP